MKRLLLIVLPILFIVGCSSSKSYSLEELRNLLSDKTMEEVKELLGPPDHIGDLSSLKNNNNEYIFNHEYPQFSKSDKRTWKYMFNKKILYDPWSEKYMSIEVQILDGKVFSVHQF